MLTFHTMLAIVSIVLATFILEDAATVIVAMKVQEHELPVTTALIGLYLGIILGDIGLYYLGMGARLWPFLRRWVHVDSKNAGRNWLATHLFRVVFAARFLPGTRLPLYTCCGFLKLPVTPFLGAVVTATLIWTTAFFFVSLKIGAFTYHYLGAWRWLGIFGFIVSIIAISSFFARMGKTRHES